MSNKFEEKIPMSDGNFLAATLYTPTVTPAPVLIEALPYRKDDLTACYSSEYERLSDEFGFIVCRIDLRGTGSSSGIALDEYDKQEKKDLTEAIKWLSKQSWSTGNIGMFGTSYSGFNSLHLATESIPELKAICSIYATDDRWSDDVHYCGGSLKLLDQVDYPLYMVASNALPPVPAVFGDGWVEEWKKRITATPWILKWMEESIYSPYWMNGSAKSSIDNLKTPTMIVSGWADGYRNLSFRIPKILRANGVPVYLLAGPWSHESPDYSTPGPNVDHIPVMVNWFNQFLKGEDNGHQQNIDLYVRKWSEPSITAKNYDGYWVKTDVDTINSSTKYETISLRNPAIKVCHSPTVGINTWNSCSGSLPWGLPDDQTSDNSQSACIDSVFVRKMLIVGHPKLKLRVKSESSRSSICVHLCSVKGQKSILVSRGFLNLSHIHKENPKLLDVNEWYDVEVELDACAYEFDKDEILRVAISITEFPNVMAPPEPHSIYVDTNCLLSLPIFSGKCVESNIISTQNNDTTNRNDGVEWKMTRDVLNNEFSSLINHGSSYESLHNSNVVESYYGIVSINEKSWEQSAHGRVEYRIGWGSDKSRSLADLDIKADKENINMILKLRVHYNDEEIFNNTWKKTFPRKFG